ncbi:peptidoglycan DD-metalloendopeptidase family protein [Jeotgalibacillus sp. ET6]|uniref:peptidoglycan DD-metalloendopeptidase family protein n=1 Tax=Jeotgalibacillus sp. ET6 TaxID=3037260 RepID=UPI0024187AF7|nr:peptidoglycan DD-metalloendopeptidase family protein [Jeotgalibacillus sp. ET6]MDG5470944.1 peptidoglycan DD-metalloendopeptidase family protein [Jeotgalibacillus sp. ET6]
MRHPSLIKMQAAEKRKGRIGKITPRRTVPVQKQEPSSSPQDQAYWFVNRLLVKSIVSVVIVAAALWIHDHPQSIPDKVKEPIITLAATTFSFASLQEKWGGYLGYSESGPQSAVYSSELLYAAPVSSFSDSTMSKQGDQLVISAGKGENVYATESGIVLYIGAVENERMMVIQHADDRETIYEGIDPASFRPFDHVQRGQIIGQVVGGGGFMFSVRDKQGFLDPSELFLENEE